MLSNAETQLLLAIYRMDIHNAKEPDINEFQLNESRNNKTREVGFYLLKHQSLGYIEFNGNPFTKGGSIHKDYQNNICMIWWKKIHITPKGIEYIKNIKKSIHKQTLLSRS